MLRFWSQQFPAGPTRTDCPSQLDSGLGRVYWQLRRTPGTAVLCRAVLGEPGSPGRVGTVWAPRSGGQAESSPNAIKLETEGLVGVAGGTGASFLLRATSRCRKSGLHSTCAWLFLPNVLPLTSFLDPLSPFTLSIYLRVCLELTALRLDFVQFLKSIKGGSTLL